MHTNKLDLFAELVSAQIAAWNTVDNAAKTIPKMSAARLLALKMLLQAPAGLKVTDIARQQNISDSAASKLCDRLVKDGLVSRERSVQDKRIQVVVITPAGRDAVTAALETGESAAERFFAALTAEQQQQLGELLKQLL